MDSQRGTPTHWETGLGWPREKRWGTLIYSPTGTHWETPKEKPRGLRKPTERAKGRRREMHSGSRTQREIQMERPKGTPRKTVRSR